MNIRLTSTLLSLITATLLSTHSTAVEMQGKPEYSDESITTSTLDEANTRALRGELLSLDKDRTLTTSVGIFKLPTTASIEDHRKGKQKKSYVSITFFRDRIRKVVIY